MSLLSSQFPFKTNPLPKGCSGIWGCLAAPRTYWALTIHYELFSCSLIFSLPMNYGLIGSTVLNRETASEKFVVVSKANRANTDLSIAKLTLLKAISQWVKLCTLKWGHDSWFGNDLEAERINDNLLLVEQLTQELVYIFLLKGFWNLL